MAETDPSPLAGCVSRAAVKWCGEKERETFPEDIAYFKHNWQSLPGLRAYVGDQAILALLSSQPDTREAVRNIADRLRHIEQCDCAARSEGECCCGAWTGDKAAMLATELERLCDEEG